MGKYLRFYGVKGFDQKGLPDVIRARPILINMEDISMTMARKEGVVPEYSIIYFLNKKGRAAFSIYFGPVAANDDWESYSLLTAINEVIVRAAGEGWAKLVYDVGQGVGNNPMVTDVEFEGSVGFVVLGVSNPQAGQTLWRLPQFFGLGL